jgi:hypothetical protein
MSAFGHPEFATDVRFGSKADIQATFEYDYTQKGAQVRGAS